MSQPNAPKSGSQRKRPQPKRAQPAQAQRSPQPAPAQRTSRHHGSSFGAFAKRIDGATGHPAAFCAALLLIAGWALSGPLFHFSDTWQLVINTGTTIITFLMVFLIQNAQSRNTEAIQAKLDELIRAASGAQNAMIDLEDLDEEDLHRIHERFAQVGKEAREHPAKDGPRDASRSDR